MNWVTYLVLYFFFVLVKFSEKGKIIFVFCKVVRILYTFSICRVIDSLELVSMEINLTKKTYHHLL